MDLKAFTKQISGFKTFPNAEKMLVIGYWLHEDKKVDWFKPSDINAGFEALHLGKPANASSQLTGMTTGWSKRLIKNSKGFKLIAGTRDRIAAMCPQQAEPKQIAVELKKLEALLTDAQQKTFLAETIQCFQHEAYRASIVMGWNLAYHHVCAYIVARHLVAFNAQLQKVHKKGPLSKHSDFEDLKESTVIEVGKGANILSKATGTILSAKLTTRNLAAHPSSWVASPITAEEVITDLVHNIILRPTL